MKVDQVWTFFYGSYMNLDVLAEIDFFPEHREIARLSGYEISIRPLANLTRSEVGLVYGLLATATHDELERLYAHARVVLGGVYHPEAVLTLTMQGSWRPALCYIAYRIPPASATDAYIDRILGPARAYGFPPWYLEKLESFRPAPVGDNLR
jgi:hypothetical protein